MSEVLCYTCWYQSFNRYGRACSGKGIIEPREITCNKYAMECNSCGGKCVPNPPEPSSSGSQTWFCPKCGWTPDGIKGIASDNQ